MLDPAGLRKILLEFTLRHAAHLAACIEKDGARAGGALVEGENELFHLAHRGAPQNSG